jgi:hypothetical protein
MVGARHVLYGSDYPFDRAAGPLADQLAGTGLGGGDIAMIAATNAVRRFGLPLGV